MQSSFADTPAVLLNVKASEDRVSFGAMTAGCSMLKFRDPRTSGLQLLTTFMLISTRTTKQAITNLNHVESCLSYQQVWRRLKVVSRDQETIEQIARQ